MRLDYAGTKLECFFRLMRK